MQSLLLKVNVYLSVFDILILSVPGSCILTKAWKSVVKVQTMIAITRVTMTVAWKRTKMTSKSLSGKLSPFNSSKEVH